MKNHKDLLIIIPAYNEGKTIGALLEQLTAPDIAAFADILVMNDCSKDNTEEVARGFHVAIVNHVYNLGYGSGLQVGYKYAVSKGYKYVIKGPFHSMFFFESIYCSASINLWTTKIW